MKPTTVLIVEDHLMMREALITILERGKGIKVVGQAKDGRDGANQAARLKPDVVTLDVAMPNLNGLDAARLIRLRSTASRILILSSYEEDFFIQRALEAGVDGYISKTAAAETLARAVRDVAKGLKVFSPTVKKRIPQYKIIPGQGQLLRRKSAILTEREIEVLQLIAEGNANKQTAGKLDISIKTVEKHRQAVMDKLHIHETAGLTRYAIAAGLIETPAQFTMRPILTHSPK